MILNEPSTTNNESININIQDKKKKITSENVILKSNIEEENDNETISQNEEMIKKQRQITNYDPNSIETIKTNNSISNSYYYHKLGNCYAFFGNKSGDPLFIIGPQWPMFFALTIVLNTIVCFLLIKFWKYCTVFFRGFGIFCASFFQITFTRCFVANPGFPKNDIGRQTGIPKEKYKFCPECKFYYDLSKNVNHCFDCGICIEGYDHHCPWVSKCIGKNNLYSFYCFMTGILLNFAFAIICLTTIE
jgi:hypothetical protein